MTNKIETDLQNIFPIPSIDQWKDTVTLDLKGKTADKLVRSNYDGINIKPIYNEADTNDLLFKNNFPGFLNYLRGFKPDGNVLSKWLIAQEIYATDVTTLKKKIIHDIANGLNCVYLSIYYNDENIFLNSCKTNNVAEVREFLSSNEFSNLPFVIYNYNSPAVIKEIFTGLELNSEIIIESDIFSSIFYKGEFSTTAFSELEKNSSSCPGLTKLITLNGAPVINAGGTATQELAIILSMASEFFNNTSLDANKFSAILAMDSDFFLNIAKVRALRILWSNLVSGAGKEISDGLFIHAVNSEFNKSRLDRHNNILRSATETFSAALSDCDAITTLPYDFIEGSSTELAERIARNAQLVISNESHTGKVIDPLGGTFYVEYLTNELANISWKMFIEIENQGGFIKASRSGYIKELISEEAKKKFNDISKCKFKLTGVNFTPNAKDNLKPVTENNDYRFQKSETSDIICDAITFKRLSKDFENLRMEIQGDKNHNKIFILSFGELREHKARTDFTSSFLETGGFNILTNSNSNDIENSLNELKDSGCKVAIVCSSDENYDSKLLEILAPVKNSYTFILAGKPGERESEYREAGISDFIFMNCNYIEKLKAIAEKAELNL